ncbi:MAG: hypothetical protein IAI48_03995 [Candidatus Eremiobacteraeota bacterium]|nr:hypothetical protein [Candidatus Eremiobacteraeota bacterium]
MPSVPKVALAISFSLAFSGAAASATQSRALPSASLMRADLGARAATRPTDVVIVLAHRNQGALYALLAAIAGGRARPIGHADFVRDYAPSAAARSTVTRFLSSSGFAIVRNGEDAIVASAPANVVDRTLGTSIHDLRLEGRGDYYAPMSRVTIPTSIASVVTSVVASNLPMHHAR